jgi:hypothetical protein
MEMVWAHAWSIGRPLLSTSIGYIWPPLKLASCDIASSSIPFQRWEEEQPEHFERVVEKLHALTAEIVDLHADLVRGRKHLIGAGKADQEHHDLFRPVA